MTSPGPLTADQCEQIYHAAMAAGDIDGVYAALTAMAVRDPHRAQDLKDLTLLCLRVAGNPVLRRTVMAALQATADDDISATAATSAGKHVLVTSLVTVDGEQQDHPKGSVVTSISVRVDGAPDPESLGRFVDLVRAQIQRKAQAL